jgi:hypothetical protein
MVKIRKIGGYTQRWVMNMVLQAVSITIVLLLVFVKNGFLDSSEQRLPLPPSNHGAEENLEASLQQVRRIPTPTDSQGIEQSQQLADSFFTPSTINPYFKGPPACHGFFTVLANAWIPDEATSCNATYHKFEEQLMVHNQQLQRMNSTMKIFTTWTPEQLQEPGCHLNQYPALEPVQFDPEQILLDHGFTDEHVDWVRHWGNVPHPALRRNHLVARLSDIFRIVLGMKYSLAYADLDMVYLSDDAALYLQVPNVAVPIWQEEKGAFEIQNSGFCFTRPQLQVLLNDTLKIVRSKGPDQISRNMYFYTQLGKCSELSARNRKMACWLIGLALRLGPHITFLQMIVVGCRLYLRFAFSMIPLYFTTTAPCHAKNIMANNHVTLAFTLTTRHAWTHTYAIIIKQKHRAQSISACLTGHARAWSHSFVLHNV